MYYELFALIILFISLIGLGVIIFRKIPVLMELPETVEKSSREPFWPRLKEIVKNLPGLKSFSPELFLQKIISKIRILSLKTDNKTANWLQKLRERYQKKRAEETDNYWEEIKKSTKDK